MLVNGECLKKRHLLKAGDEVEVSFLLTPEISLEPQNIALDVLFEDEHLIAVNKPAGMVVHPAPGHPDKTFVNALLYHCRSLNVYHAQEGLVNFDSARQSQIEAQRSDRESHSKTMAAETRRKSSGLSQCEAGERSELATKKDRFGKVAASQNSPNLTERGITDPVRPGIVHRLDKDTSGVLLAAKTSEAHAKLVELFAERRMHKDYLAVCVGTPREGLIDAPIRRHPTQRKEMAVCFEQGKEAKSRCKVLGKNGQLSLVQIQLLTGRTHQIRVHLKHIGAPVLGDAVYGNAGANKKFGAARQLLHASRLQFQHPITDFPLEICAPIPKDLLLYTEIFHT